MTASVIYYGAVGRKNYEVYLLNILVNIRYVAQLAQQFSPARQISNHYHYLYLYKLIVFTLNEYENICIAGPIRRGGYAILNIPDLPKQVAQ